MSQISLFFAAPRYVEVLCPLRIWRYLPKETDFQHPKPRGYCLLIDLKCSNEWPLWTLQLTAKQIKVMKWGFSHSVTFAPLRHALSIFPFKLHANFQIPFLIHPEVNFALYALSTHHKVLHVRPLWAHAWMPLSLHSRGKTSRYAPEGVVGEISPFWRTYAFFTI